MCGIVGYIGSGNTLKVLIEGLKRLEYRGYDSAGIAYQNGTGIEILKTSGKIRDLQKLLPAAPASVKSGLGHTRWATHGAPSSLNAHPHCIDGITVVHNGIIENYRELRDNLKAEGHEFHSETDTEVIPQLISWHLAAGLTVTDAIIKTLGKLRGSFSLGIMSESLPDTLFAVKRGSPFVVGLGDSENYFASDIPAILPYTSTFIYMEDNQICTLTKDSIAISNFESGSAVACEQKTVQIDWSPALAEKNGFDHFMLKEIFEQPRAVADTIGEWIGCHEKLLDELSLDTRTILGIRRIQIVACGTSYHAGLIGRHLIENLARIPVEVDIASEFRYRNPIIENGTLALSITQSGETADTLAAQQEVRRKGARTLTVCNMVGSTASREADSVLYTRAGLEIGVASTKAFTAQLAALQLLALAIGVKRGRITSGEARVLEAQLLKIPYLIEKTLEKDPLIKDIAGTLLDAKGFLFLGRGINYPVALEGALKLKEISYLHAEGYPAGEMKHGPIALIDSGMPIVVVAPLDEVSEKTLSNIEEVKARGGRVIAVTDSASYLRDKVNDLIEVPSTNPLFSPLVTIVALQLLAYHTGVLKGCDVDQPRNLAKSVTVE